MAEVRKNAKVEKYNIDEIKVSSKEKVKIKKKVSKSKNNNKKVTKEKKSLWQKIMFFCNGVKSEVKRVHWTDKRDMVKYSIATIVFIVFCSAFFYLIDIIFALVQSLFN